jgi:hypothetical protein
LVKVDDKTRAFLEEFEQTLGRSDVSGVHPTAFFPFPSPSKKQNFHSTRQRGGACTD